MSSLLIYMHPKAEAEFEAMVASGDENAMLAAAQLMQLLSMAEAVPRIRDRLMGNHEVVNAKISEGKFVQVDIKMILDLKEIACDDKYFTDAVRRIRELDNPPADRYRVFFAPRKNLNGVFRYQVLGVFARKVAYDKATLDELKNRYENS